MAGCHMAAVAFFSYTGAIRDNALFKLFIYKAFIFCFMWQGVCLLDDWMWCSRLWRGGGTLELISLICAVWRGWVCPDSHAIKAVRSTSNTALATNWPWGAEAQRSHPNQHLYSHDPLPEHIHKNTHVYYPRVFCRLNWSTAVQTTTQTCVQIQPNNL